jgi:hypothetical protein
VVSSDVGLILYTRHNDDYDDDDDDPLPSSSQTDASCARRRSAGPRKILLIAGAPRAIEHRVRRARGGPPHPLLVLLVSSSVADIHVAMAMAKTTTVGGRTVAIRRAMAEDDPTTRQGDAENGGNATDEDFPTQSPTPNPTEVLPLADCFLLSLSEDGCADAEPDC